MQIDYSGNLQSSLSQVVRLMQLPWGVINNLIPALSKKVDEIGLSSKKVILFGHYSKAYEMVDSSESERWLLRNFKANGLGSDVGFLDEEKGAEFVGKAGLNLMGATSN